MATTASHHIQKFVRSIAEDVKLYPVSYTHLTLPTTR